MARITNMDCVYVGAPLDGWLMGYDTKVERALNFTWPNNPKKELKAVRFFTIAAYLKTARYFESLTICTTFLTALKET